MVACVALLLSLNGCDSRTLSSDITPVDEGSLEFSVQLNSPGMLSARSLGLPAQPEKARLLLVSDLDDTLRFEVPLTSSKVGYQRLSLPSSRHWSMEIEARDAQDSLLYQGASQFFLEPNQNLILELVLDSRYSGIKLVFPMRRGLARFSVEIDGNVVEDSLASGLDGDSLVLFYPYLSASKIGVDHRVKLKVYGVDLDSNVNIFYALDTSVNVKSSQTYRYVWELPWVGGDNPPPGELGLFLKAGFVGTLSGTVVMANRFDGSFVTDPRDGLVYRANRIGGLNWFFQNLGSTCAGCDSVGRLFEPAELETACPPGWRVPDTSQWRQLIESVGGMHHLKTRTGWEDYNQINFYGDFEEVAIDGSKLSNGDDSLGFSLAPTGIFQFNNTMFRGRSETLTPFGQYMTSDSGVSYGVSGVTYLSLNHGTWTFDAAPAFTSTDIQESRGAVRCVQL